MLMGLLVYSVASISCLLSSSIAWLLMSRILQGFGAGSGSILMQTIVREAYDDHEKHQFFSSAGFVIAFSIALGPFMGGYINEWFGWRANFAVLVCMGLGLFIISLMRLPETLHKQSHDQKPETLKVMRLLIKDKQVWGSMWLVGAINGLLFSYYAESPFIFIKIIGLTPGEYGWLGLFIATAALLGSLVSRKLGHYLQQNTIIKAGCFVMLVSSLFLVSFSSLGLINPHHVTTAILVVMLPMMGIIFGSFGLIIPVTLSQALVKYKQVLGSAGAVFGLSYYICIAGLTWLMGLIHNGTVFPMPIYFVLLSLSVTLVFYIFINSETV